MLVLAIVLSCAAATGIGAAPREAARGPVSPVVIDGTVKCVFLRIAPYQRFNPPLSNVKLGEVALHDPDGYVNTNGVLQLEDAMRLGAASSGCPASRGTGKSKETFRYTLTLEYREKGAPSFTPFVSSVVSTAQPVSLPADAMPPTFKTVAGGSLRAIGRIQSCSIQQTCGPATTLWTKAYAVSVYRQGSLASVDYDKTVLSLEDWDRVRGEAVRAKSLRLAAPIASRSVIFTATGRTTTNPDQTRDISLSPGQQLSVPFGIYPQDFYDPESIGFSKAENGTDQRSGLRWPRVFGSNRGKPFWYSARLPNIVRDRIANCTPDPDSYYRFPWRSGEVHRVAQSNNTLDPGDSHSTISSQRYAFDFTMPVGTQIRAARGGRVTLVRNGHPDAMFDASKPRDKETNYEWGNTVRILHEDGTTAWYFHLKKGNVSVKEGQWVLRGQPIGRSGISGRSFGPHLHFQVQGDSIDWGQTIRIRFSGTSLSPTNKSFCLAPGAKWQVISDNANPKFP